MCPGTRRGYWSDYARDTINSTTTDTRGYAFQIPTKVYVGRAGKNKKPCNTFYRDVWIHAYKSRYSKWRRMPKPCTPKRGTHGRTTTTSRSYHTGRWRILTSHCSEPTYSRCREWIYGTGRNSTWTRRQCINGSSRLRQHHHRYDFVGRANGKRVDYKIDTKSHSTEAGGHDQQNAVAMAT